MTEMDVIATLPAVYLPAALLLGLMVGSFLNVVIHRLPIMMERAWAAQCAELNGQPPPPADPFNLLVPRSRCPACAAPVAAWQNIPLFSYLWLRGRCAHCHAAISVQYPLVEAATGLLSLITVWHVGFTVQALAALLLTWALIALSVIDIRHQLLPDVIVLPLLWLGLLLALGGVTVPLDDAVLGAVIGYLALWAVYWAFKLLTGKEGMGYGDFKLLAMLGAWQGWQMLPAIILMSSLVGAVWGIAMILIQGRDRAQPLPFGQYLAAAGWITLLWGVAINRWYLNLVGLH